MTRDDAIISAIGRLLEVVDLLAGQIEILGPPRRGDTDWMPEIKNALRVARNEIRELPTKGLP